MKPIQMHLAPIIELLKQHSKNSDILVKRAYLSRQRIEFTLEHLKKYKISGKRVCEIGFGIIGIASHLELGALVDAYDIDDAYKSLCNHLNISWKYLNLENKIESSLMPYQYDLIILCEVIEHINRSPVEVLRELRQWLLPGGHLLISTVNLVRLSSRIRLMAGKELFARYTPQSFIEGHQREYTLAEMNEYLRAAGYVEEDLFYFTEPDLLSSAPCRIGYTWSTKLFPTLSNFIFASAKNPD